MEVLDLRTYRDLQYVRNTESLMKVVDGKLKVASENPRGLNLKGFQVIGCLSPPVLWRVCVYYCRVNADAIGCSIALGVHTNVARSTAISFAHHRQ